MNFEASTHQLSNEVMRLLAERRALQTSIEHLRETERQLIETIRELEERIES